MVVPAGDRSAEAPVMNARHRSTDLFTSARVAQQLVLGPEVYPVDDPICTMKREIGAVCESGKIYIVCGEAHPDVYNEDGVLEAFSIAHGRNAKITVLTGPILLVPDGEREHNGLITLFDAGIIRLYHRPRRLAASHFRVVETGAQPLYYSECAHPPLLDVSQRTCENFDHFAPEQFKALAEKAIRDFTHLKKRSGAVDHKTASSKGQLLVTTPKKLDLLMERAWEQNLPIEYLDAEELQALQPADEPWLMPIRAYRERLTSQKHEPATT
jgi:hypothetical protein